MVSSWAKRSKTSLWLWNLTLGKALFWAESRSQEKVKLDGRNAGLCIDHLLPSPELTPRLRAVGVDKDVRAMEKTSDHASTWFELGS
jgi:hypothetical protein